MNQRIEFNDYATWLGEVKSRIQSARFAATRAVNHELILLYWDIGRGIVEKQARLSWGRSVVERLAKDLQAAFPGTRGFSANNLWLTRQFYSEYTSEGFLERLVQEPGQGHDPQPDLLKAEILERFVQEFLAPVPWGHHLEIMKKAKAPSERLFYLLNTRQFGWTRKVLLNQIKAGAYRRSLAEGKSHNFAAALPEHLSEQAQETLKSSYNLEFLGIGRAMKERELESRLTERLKDFVLELGYGFCFIGRQYRLALGRKEYLINLLFYHRFLKCLVAIELKIGEFEPEYAGKMDFYLNVLNEKERGPDDNLSIGIILCAEKDDVEVEFALRTKTSPIGVAEYQLEPKLPRELKGKLPTAGQLSEALGLPEKKPKSTKK